MPRTERQKIRQRELRNEYREKVFTLLGKICNKCGFSDARALQLDHVNSDGAEERREIKSNKIKFYKRVLREPHRYQILCANCNAIKVFTHKEVPYLQDLSRPALRLAYRTKKM